MESFTTPESRKSERLAQLLAGELRNASKSQRQYIYVQLTISRVFVFIFASRTTEQL